MNVRRASRPADLLLGRTQSDYISEADTTLWLNNFDNSSLICSPLSHCLVVVDLYVKYLLFNILDSVTLLLHILFCYLYRYSKTKYTENVLSIIAAKFKIQQLMIQYYAISKHNAKQEKTFNLNKIRHEINY